MSAGKSCEISIIIVSYNTRELTLACLESIYAMTREVSFEVVVIDNASSDGSAAEISTRYPYVKLIASKSNLGFAKANNLAVPDAEGEYILLLNPDTLVLDGAIDTLTRFAKKNPEYDIFNGRTLFGNRSLNPTSCWRKPTVWNAFCRASGLSSIAKNSGIFNSDAYGGWQRDSMREIDIVSGCFLLTRKALWQDLGGFDTSYFMYGEDWDLCLRAKQRGMRCLFCPDAVIIHYGGASEPVRADKLVRLFQTKAKLYADHYGFLRGCVLVFMLRLWAVRCMIVGSLLGIIGKSNSGKSATVWRDVWRRREEWTLKSRHK